MKEERLFYIIGLLEEELIDEAEDQKPLLKSVHGFSKRFLAAAACLIFLLGGAWYFTSQIGRFGGNSGDGNGGGSGHPEGSTFMHYTGPVMPLHVAGDTRELSAERTLYYDFTENIARFARIQDRYSITNASSEDKTVTVLYPFVSSLSDSFNDTPVITVDEKSLETELLLGNYSGGFTGVDGAYGEDNTSYNLMNIKSWEGYKALLEDGEYLRSAQIEPVLKDQEVTVYTFWDTSYPAEYDAAALAIAFTLPAESRVITYNMNGMSYDDTTNAYQFGYFLSRNSGQRVIILGEAPAEFTLKGYKNLSYEKEVKEITGTVRTENKLLSEVIAECLDESSRYLENNWEMSSLITRQLQYRAVISMFQYTQLGDSPKDRYQWMTLDDLISEAHTMQRIMYQKGEITIPAGGTIELNSSFGKGASYDFYSAGASGNQGVVGYDMVTKLGSDLNITDQYAGIRLPANVQIIRQNFGFDPENGVTTVELDREQEHYYLELKPVETGD